MNVNAHHPPRRARLGAALLVFLLAAALPRLSAAQEPSEALVGRLAAATVYIENQVVLASADWDALPEKVRQSLGHRPQGPASGSGVLVSGSGLVLTNAHVIGDFEQAVPVTGGEPLKWHFVSTGLKVVVRAGQSGEKSYPPHVVRVDKRADLALLKISAGEALPALPLAPETPLEAGRQVFMAGFPGGKLPDAAPFTGGGGKINLAEAKNPRVSINAGMITAVRQRDRDMIYQLDIRANPGNSGGPIINPEGQVVALLNAGIPSMQSINYAIPVRYFRLVLPANATESANADTTDSQSYEAFKSSGTFKLKEP